MSTFPTVERRKWAIFTVFSKFDFLGKRATGARVCFRTNAQSFTVELELETISVDIGMSLYACQSAFVFIGDRKNSRFAGIVGPTDYSQLVSQATFEKHLTMEDVTIYLPRNEIVKCVTVTIPDGATIEEPTPYKYPTPVFSFD